MMLSSFLPRSMSLNATTSRPLTCNAPIGESCEVRIQLHAAPPSTKSFGDNGGCARAQERVEHQTRLPTGVAGAVGAHAAEPVAAPFASPGSAAVVADALRTAELHRPLDQSFGIDGEVRAGECRRG